VQAKLGKIKIHSKEFNMSYCNETLGGLRKKTRSVNHQLFITGRTHIL